MKKLNQAMLLGEGITLSPDEVLGVYLALARLADLEKFGKERDWEAIEAYCPKEGGAS